MSAWIHRQFPTAVAWSRVPELVVRRSAGSYAVATIGSDGVRDLGSFPNAGRAWAAIDRVDAPALGLGPVGASDGEPIASQAGASRADIARARS